MEHRSGAVGFSTCVWKKAAENQDANFSKRDNNVLPCLYFLEGNRPTYPTYPIIALWTRAIIIAWHSVLVTATFAYSLVAVTKHQYFDGM